MFDADEHLWTFLGGDYQEIDKAVEEVRRQNEISQAAGTLATDRAFTYPEEQFQAASFLYVNHPEITIPAGAQLAFTEAIYTDLGYDSVLGLSQAQSDTLGKVVDAFPGWRVVPAALADNIEERQAVVEKARAFPAQQFDPHESALRPPDEGTVYSRLVEDLDAVVEIDGKHYVARYKIPRGGHTNRGNYKAALKETGQAVESDGRLWTIPVMDVRVKTPRVRETSGQLYDRINPVASPEAHIFTALLHQAAGTPVPGGLIDHVNEMVFKADELGVPISLEYVGTVRWRDDWRRIGSYARQKNSERNMENKMGVRAATSGI